jgi:hypothetical protein
MSIVRTRITRRILVTGEIIGRGTDNFYQVCEILRDIVLLSIRSRDGDVEARLHVNRPFRRVGRFATVVSGSGLDFPVARMVITLDPRPSGVPGMISM